MKKIRLDSYLAEQKLSLSREKAKKEIISGWVKVNGETSRNPSLKIYGDEKIVIERPGGIFISRGGEKLAHAIREFKIDLSGSVVLDIGASTGGFTDCMLRSGALKVYALDVGYNQLDYSLRIDKRVVVMEKTHARDININMFPDKIDFFTMDVSFISIQRILPVVFKTFSSITGIILIKPQFEAEPSQHKKGVVRNPEDHKKILLRVFNGVLKTGFTVEGLTYSPVRGPAGNIEFFIYVNKQLQSDSQAKYNSKMDSSADNDGEIDRLQRDKMFVNENSVPGDNWDDRISEIVEISHNKLK